MEIGVNLMQKFQITQKNFCKSFLKNDSLFFHYDLIWMMMLTFSITVDDIWLHTFIYICVQLECWESWLQHISSYQFPINCCLRSFNTFMNLSLDFIASEIERERKKMTSVFN